MLPSCKVRSGRWLQFANMSDQYLCQDCRQLFSASYREINQRRRPICLDCYELVNGASQRTQKPAHAAAKAPPKRKREPDFVSECDICKAKRTFKKRDLYWQRNPYCFRCMQLLHSNWKAYEDLAKGAPARLHCFGCNQLHAVMAGDPDNEVPNHNSDPLLQFRCDEMEKPENNPFVLFLSAFDG